LSEAELAQLEAWKIDYTAKADAEMPMPVVARLPIKLTTAVPMPARRAPQQAPGAGKAGRTGEEIGM
jgi:hypothetical protein